MWWCLLLWACRGEAATPTAPAPAPAPQTTGATADTAPLDPPDCPSFGEAEPVGALTDPTLVELSGLARAGGRLWAHNDSGTPELVALSDTGATLQRVRLKGAVSADWEDLTLRGQHLWVGDIGDNRAVRTSITLYAVQVPDEGVKEAAARSLELTWPQGPVDSEAMFADPVSGDLLLMSKVFDGQVTVARVPDPDGEGPQVLEPVATVVFGEDGIGRTTLVTGADMSPDGRFVVVRTYLSAWAFPRVPREPWSETFGREPCEVPAVVERQGEAITWDETGVWTVSEGKRVPLHRTPVD